MGGLNNRNLLSHWPGGWKSETQVSAGLVPPEASLSWADGVSSARARVCVSLLRVCVCLLRVCVCGGGVQGFKICVLVGRNLAHNTEL